MNVTWLGQSGYLLEAGGRRLALDPYLSDVVEREQGLRRLVPPPLSAERLAPDVLLITHDHLDHFDPDAVPAILSASPGCVLAGPASVRAHGARLGVAPARMAALDAGATVRFGDVEVTATPARHSDASAVGLLIRSGVTLLWFSGDTLYASDLAARVLALAGRVPDAAFVCMNGKLNNMNIPDAARLVAELRTPVAVPAHYGMFAENTADPGEFVAACSGTGRRTVVLECGRTVCFGGGAGAAGISEPRKETA